MNETWVREVNDDGSICFADLRGEIAASFNTDYSYDIYVNAVNELDAAEFANYIDYCRSLTPEGIPVDIEIVD